MAIEVLDQRSQSCVVFLRLGTAKVCYSRRNAMQAANSGPVGRVLLGFGSLGIFGGVRRKDDFIQARSGLLEWVLRSINRRIWANAVQCSVGESRSAMRV